MVGLPEKSLLEVILRVREIASEQWWTQLILYITTSYGTVIVLAVAIGLAMYDRVGVRGMGIWVLVAMVLLVINVGFNPRAQFARAEVAFNDIAWRSRMDAIIGNKEDPELDRQPELRARIKADLKRAASLLNSVEAAALVDLIRDPPLSD